MAELSGNKASVIKLTDPDLPQFLDFKELRKEGLEHIGNLSGKIWTDHNVHDPGITILEVLVYALMDLGYKTNLPIEDLIAHEDEQHGNDNFLTPLEVLTINPVTITDYRKLLLELPGVRNAWLEPVNDESLYVNPFNNTLSCNEVGNATFRKCNNFNNDNEVPPRPGFLKIQLNGLYNVYIEKESDVKNNAVLIDEVKKLLSAYRNLCEDVFEINVLKPVDIGVCAEVELNSGFSPEVVYKEIIKAIRNFIQPQINYYTLNGLLDKGKSIDEIFAGRPYRKESYGFVDTDELEQLERRGEIHLSDLYHVVLSVEGVRKIKKIHIKGLKGTHVDAIDWVQGNMICDGEVPVFSLENTCIDLYSSEGLLLIDKTKINKTLSFPKKFELPSDSLDAKVPTGTYREDLDHYYSIQNDFPVVYGIGDDGLPENATLLRKTQALQLKGYLMFYDQILANYTSQLANMGSLFSIKPEQEKTLQEKQTYFTQITETAPGIDKLLKFYEQNSNLTEGLEFAVTVSNDLQWKEALELLKNNSRTELTIGNYCNGKSGLVNLFTFSSSNIRAIYINQLVDSFFNDNYTIEILSDRFGYFFVLCPQSPNDVLLVGTKRFQSENDAKNEANNVAFFASILENYNLVTNKSESVDPDMHYFGISYHPVSYLNIIQKLTENKDEYIARRKQFLDHLLARFGEDFTDYTLLKYRQKINKEDFDEQTVNDQSAYLNQFAEVSRNRGKAFNYLEPSWNTDNVSGFEKRTTLLSGLNNYTRRNLCNFEVTPCFKLLLKDPSGNILFRSNRSYETREALSNAAEKLLVQLRNEETYKQLEKNLNGFNSSVIHRIFSEQAADENIVISKYNYHQELLNYKNDIVTVSDNSKMASSKIATDTRDEFIKAINSRKLSASTKEKNKLRLLPIERKNCYLDTNQLDLKIDTLISWKWHLLNTGSKDKVESKSVFNDYEEAWDHLINNETLDAYVTEHDTALNWSLKINNKILFSSVNSYPDAYKAVAAWRQAKTWGSTSKNLSIEGKDNTFKIYLKGEKDNVIAVSNEINTTDFNKETAIEDSVKIFNNRSSKPDYNKIKNKFGFKVPVGVNQQPFVSYCVYDSKKEALKEINKVYQFGGNKKNYLLSGDEGNPEYNFIIRDEFGSFLALPPDHFETASDRNRSLTSVTKFLKSNELPVAIKEEPRRYVWSLYEGEKEILKSDTEFASKAKSKADFDKVAVAEAVKGNHPVFEEHLYEFKVESTPALYNFLYGDSNSQGEFSPIFISKDTYKTYESASKAYTGFVKKIQTFSLIVSKKEADYEFALFDAANEKQPIAFQYKKEDVKADAEKASAIMAYMSTIYTNEGQPNPEFVASEMSENENGMFEWRFYKKNSPVAISRKCPERASAERIKAMICDLVPPVNLKQCPPKNMVVCPKKDPKKYHYQICFNDNENHEFVLISYLGYDNYEAAEEAYKNEFLNIIGFATDATQYGTEGKISIEEIYKNSESNSACDETSFIAVIPEEKIKELKEQGHDIIEYYTKLADIFPIYKIEEEEKTTFKYEVVIPQPGMLKGLCECAENEVGDCEDICGCCSEKKHLGSLLWTSVECYTTYEEALLAYQHFYVLAGSSNNCRILCEKGCFYVGLVEVLAESFCEFQTEEEAWNDVFPDKKDDCKNCVPGGVREFVYAADNDKNYIPVCDQKYWKFKIVSPSYFVVNHNCYYSSEAQRDEQMQKWMEVLKKLDWTKYGSYKSGAGESNASLSSHFNTNVSFIDTNNSSRDTMCSLVEIIRACLKECPKTAKTEAEIKEAIKLCLKEKLKDERISKILEEANLDVDALNQLANYFPVYKSDNGYCYRLYWKENDKKITENGLQPCGCDDVIAEDGNQACNEPFPFISSNCYSCCTEALNAFRELCELITSGLYSVECTSKGENGPYSFQIVDKSKELAYHPQQYDSLQEVKDAIKLTKECVNDMGMHVLEHILLRPRTENEFKDQSVPGTNQRFGNCLLPICPDYCCDIEWQPDMDKDDPCAQKDNTIYYLPGSDPYSFWATVALPSWSKQFRTQESRLAFEQLLYKESPALVGLNILWLSPRNMCKFEDAYMQWLDWMQDMEAPLCDPNNASPMYRLADCIKTLQSEEACPTVPGEQGDCNCKSEEVKDPSECCLPADTTGTIFWKYCPVENNYDDVRDVVTDTSAQPVTVTLTRSISSTKNEAKKAPPTKKEILAQVRQRKPAYLDNVKTASDEKMLKTKSYERTIFFLENTPTIAGYVQLVNFFNQYSLKKGNDVDAFLVLLKNATWHLFDKLTLDEKAIIKKEDLKSIKQSIAVLSEYGLSTKELNNEWHSDALKTLANPKVLNQLTTLLK
ncbi:hypothetical protein ACFSKN_08115 [Mariniflexile gromovii]|uniref:Uncharacterized protein n=1 Tax=Mariniflexile gromovii TaxID=362523 RepID=A0ABS4BUC0_9FLAO|nr:hypothetical protein [Mariniflexile gromovii]MBP0904184.1 hypothetical protein [Mariniflexile gromovii]